MSRPLLLLGTEAVTNVQLHPVVVLQALDRSLRRAEDQTRVIGTLLGRIESGVVEITDSFAVPHLENGDEVAVGRDFHTHMYELHKRVNENEVVVGWYAAGPGQLDDHSALIHQFYSSVCELPVHLVLSTDLKDDALDVAAYVSSPLEVVDTTLVHQFKQIPVTQKLSEPEVIALNAMAPKNGETKARTLPNELEALEETMEQLYKCIDDASTFVGNVVAGKQTADAKLGQEIADALAAIPMLRAEQFDQLFNTGLQDLLMVSYLSGLTQAQLSMAEKLINT
uniref:Eukaryotic translation initiation factor 3 subunit F n=1 Tax=Hyaloperonospora arabidopsidis (strain Emoy2) TaxID=559515 RepID=M4BP80_HYAAE